MHILFKLITDKLNLYNFQRLSNIEKYNFEGTLIESHVRNVFK